MPGTNCTLGQVERSIEANAPEVSRYLDRYPQLRQYRPAIEERIGVIADTCSRF